jgi:thiol-disulfide isomerase/thioredoxin
MTSQQPAVTQRPAQNSAASWTDQLRHPSRTQKIIYVVAAVAIVLVLIVTLAGGRPTKAPPPLAKNFALAELGHPGAKLSLASYPGRPVILNFFASWCAPCKRETPMIARFYASMHGRVIVLGIDSNDLKGAALRFLRSAGVKYPVGFDPYPSHTTTSYGVYALPQTFFLNVQHRIVKHVVGPVTMAELTAFARDRG